MDAVPNAAFSSTYLRWHATCFFLPTGADGLAAQPSHRVDKMKRQIGRVLAGVGFMVVSSAALAAVTPSLYCNSYGLATGVTQGAPTDAALVVGNMTLNSVASNNCFGHVNVGDYYTGNGNGQSTDVISAFANGTNTGGIPLWGGDWDFIVRDDGANSIYSQSYGGFRFDLSAPQQATSGTWTLAVTDLTPGTSPFLPVEMDLLVFVKGATEGDFFLFDERSLDDTNTGTFTMTFVQGQGPDAGPGGLSGFSVLGRELTGSDVCTIDCGPDRDLPEPTSLALVALGLIGAGAVRARRRS
jgi:PEP-CTERM motif